MKTGNPIQAAETFKAIVRQFPSASWTPYYNLQILEEKTLKQNEPVFWLDRGAFLFGRNEHYLLASAAYCLDRSYMDEAKRYLKLYLDAGGNSAIADLFLEQSSGNAKPGRYRASLQQVIESSPKEVAEQRVKHGIWFFMVYALPVISALLGRMRRNAGHRKDGPVFPSVSASCCPDH